MAYGHILVATDFSTLGDLAVQRAVSLAKAQGAKLTLLHVLPQPTSPNPLFPHYDVVSSSEQVAEAKGEAVRAMENLVAAANGEDDLKVEYEVTVGDPAMEILAADARLMPGLILVATHGRRGLSHFIMGSVAERVVRLARADVLAVRAAADA